jgi:hypothetical protein
MLKQDEITEQHGASWAFEVSLLLALDDDCVRCAGWDVLCPRHRERCFEYWRRTDDSEIHLSYMFYDVQCRSVA